MFEAIRNNKRIAQVILAILIVPFALFGLDRYFADGPGGADVATVGGTPITQNEFERAMRDQQDRLRDELGARATAALLESEELRQAVLDQLVTRRALDLYSGEMRLTVNPALLRQSIEQISAFQRDGQFSPELYQAGLRQMGLSAAGFEQQRAQEMRIEQLVGAVAEASVVPTGSVRRLLTAMLEERHVREMRFPVAPLLAGIKVDDEAIQKYYDDNRSRFERPERIKAEYVVFDEDTLEKGIEIPAADIQQAYETGDYVRPEERRMRHILISVPDDADEATVAKAKAEIDDIAAQLRKKPARFEELAKAKSQDPGSRENGGDLGYFARGVMDPAFDEAAFSQKKNEIGAPVRSVYGFHIVQITDIRPGGEKRSLAEVRDEIVAGLKRQAAAKKFAENAEKFSELVFNQEPDSLEPAAKEFGLEIKRTDWVDRASSSIADFQNEDLFTDLFADDAIVQHHNTRAIEVGANKLVAARVAEHEAARRLPLEEVRGQIEAQLRRDEAARRVREKGDSVLTALDNGEAVAGDWSAAQVIQRVRSTLPVESTRAVFAAPVTKLPVRVGVVLPDDAFVIYQIDAVEHPAFADDDPRLDGMARQYERLVAQTDLDAFLAALRVRYKVEAKLPSRVPD
ncbi:MAG: SurA N-terminal domain-containing protein [Azoarcus sp.]|jgi:peptidyl-prolyl cis-trans isomerase D|nr:SurA N-terminal domain-containing protein [Azoarcus sp.]